MPYGYLVRVSARSSALGINCRGSGGLEVNGRFLGGNWQNSATDTIQVLRQPQDGFADQVRVSIWDGGTDPTTCIPVLQSPAEGAVMDNGRIDHTDPVVWDFDWSDCPDADRYHLYVVAPGATVPLINVHSSQSSSYRHHSSMYVRNDWLAGWRWQVRAEVDGEWGKWSGIRTFDVEPPDTDSVPPDRAYLPVLFGSG